MRITRGILFLLKKAIDRKMIAGGIAIILCLSVINLYAINENYAGWGITVVDYLLLTINQETFIVFGYSSLLLICIYKLGIGIFENNVQILKFRSRNEWGGCIWGAVLAINTILICCCGAIYAFQAGCVFKTMTGWSVFGIKKWSECYELAVTPERLLLSGVVNLYLYGITLSFIYITVLFLCKHAQGTFVFCGSILVLNLAIYKSRIRVGASRLFLQNILLEGIPGEWNTEIKWRYWLSWVFILLIVLLYLVNKISIDREKVCGG